MADDKKTTDLTRDRKVKMARLAFLYLFLGLVISLGVGVFAPQWFAVLIATIYGPFCVGVGGVLAFFANANARVHEARATGSAPEGQP